MKVVFLLAALFTSFAMRAVAADIPPDEMVRKTAEEVLAIVKQDKDIQSGNRSKIFALVDAKVVPHFDFARMTRLAMGRNWSKASPEQQQALTKEFRDLLVRTYSVSLAQYRNQSLEFKPVATQPGDTEVTVKTLLVQPGRQGVPIDYSMSRTEAGWKVYDIAVDGASLVTTYRGTFNDEIRQGGVDLLLKSLRDKNQADGGSVSSPAATGTENKR